MCKSGIPWCKSSHAYASQMKHISLEDLEQLIGKAGVSHSKLGAQEGRGRQQALHACADGHFLYSLLPPPRNPTTSTCLSATISMRSHPPSHCSPRAVSSAAVRELARELARTLAATVTAVTAVKAAAAAVGTVRVMNMVAHGLHGWHCSCAWSWPRVPQAGRWAIQYCLGSTLFTHYLWGCAILACV